MKVKTHCLNRLTKENNYIKSGKSLLNVREFYFSVFVKMTVLVTTVSMFIGGELYMISVQLQHRPTGICYYNRLFGDQPVPNIVGEHSSNIFMGLTECFLNHALYNTLGSCVFST